MPRERRKRPTAHDPSVKLAKRQFAAKGNAVEHVEVGGSAEASVRVTDILNDAAQVRPQVTLKKKEKQQLKREALIQRLECSRSPYSKSHTRREKRKAKEHIAGGLSDMHAAISALEDSHNLTSIEKSLGVAVDHSNQKSTVKPKPGQIGEGKATPLNKTQRKRTLQMERLRHPMILSNPEYSSNPFQTIRTHAQNTLLMHEPPA